MLGISPHANVSQSQTVNSSIIQSAKLLHFTREALESFLLEQQRRNPLIEVENLHDPARDAADVSPTLKEQKPTREAGTPLTYRPGSSGGGGKSRSGDSLSHWVDLIPSSQSLHDHLLMQIGSCFNTPAEREIGYHVIRSIDDDGYLRSSIDLICRELDQPSDRVEVVLAKVQQMDPPGVGARNLAECLLIQLREAGQLTPVFEVLLQNLPLLAAHKVKELASLCRVSPARISEMAKVIKALTPRPGSKFNHAPVISVVPDVYVTLTEDGNFVTALNDQALPRILVNREYYSEIRPHCSTTQDIKFVTDCMHDANMLVRSLEQRAQTILKVASEIVLHQKAFILNGPEYLKPLILRDISEKIGVHQSTVSRAITNKYIMTPVGLFDLKYFFNNAVSADGGGDCMAASVVRQKVRQLTRDETADTILSDDDIVRELMNSGIQVARRTVTKYRQSLDIPSSHQRRRVKMNATNSG